MPRVDEQRVICGILAGLRQGVQWKDASNGQGAHKTRPNRFPRWRRLGVFARLFQRFAPHAPSRVRKMIAITRLRALPTAISRRKKGMCVTGLAAQQEACMPPCMVGVMAVAGQSGCC